MRHFSIRLFFIASWLTALFAGICWLFWRNEVKYTLPTPVPAQYQAVSRGAAVDLKRRFSTSFDGKPVFIHFFNPDCPCSRFNLKHVNSLVRKYHDRIAFAVVVLGEPGAYTEKEIREKLGMDLPVSFDSTIAADCGVYSTPQAVLLNAGHELYYRGNYNRSRYCTDKETNYAQMALDSFLLNTSSNPGFSPYALRAYGCSLPKCTK